MNELNPCTLEYIIADLKNKLVSYRKSPVAGLGLSLSLSLTQHSERIGQIKLLELLISNYENRLSELLIDLDNDRRK